MFLRESLDLGHRLLVELEGEQLPRAPEVDEFHMPAETVEAQEVGADEGGGDAALVLREAVDGGALEAVRGDEGAVALVLDFRAVERATTRSSFGS